MRNILSKTIKQVITEQSNDYTSLQENYTQTTGAALFLDPNAIPSQVSPSKPLTVSIIIPAYNVISSILSCLTSIEQSSFNINHQDKLQVVVVDDGSTDGTWDKIKETQFSLNLTAIRQNNHGQAQALNTGISVAEGDIVISCDADMVLSYYAIEHLVTRHQQLPNVLLTGFRTNTNTDDPRVSRNFIRQHGSHRIPCFTRDERIVFPIPGWPSNMCLASQHFKSLGHARGLWMPDGGEPWLLPDLVIGALFSLPRSVYLSIGGYDERFVGWGCADGYLAAKAIGAGSYIIPVYAASGLHINHPPRSKTKQLEYKLNRDLFLYLIRTTDINNHPNWLSNAKKRIIEYCVHSPVQTVIDSYDKNSEYLINDPSFNEIDNLLSAGEYSRVFTILSENAKIDKNGRYLLRLGKVFFGMNQYQKAIDVFKQACAFANLEADSMLNLAIAQVANNQFISAHSTLEKLSQTFPQMSDLSYWYNYSAQRHIRQGNNYFNQGFHKVARRCFEAALILEPKNRVAFKYREKCIFKEIPPK